MQRIPVVRVGDGSTSETSTDDVAVEAALEVRLNGQPFSVTMRTPGADRELAAGFLFTEGIVTAAADIVAVHVDPLGRRRGRDPDARIERRRWPRSAMPGVR